jgi:ribosomal protein S18 acetylase RimI-like enzyme
VHGTEVRALRTHEHRAAAAVASRALVDSPTSVAIYGDDTIDALAGLYGELGSFFASLPEPQVAAFAGQCVIAAAGMAPPGGCIGSFLSAGASELLNAPVAPVAPVGDPARAHVFWARWAEADPVEEHWHLGPVGVEPGYQGRGVGGEVMRAVCTWLDEGGRRAWLETDKARNVRFYSALGFEVATQADILGVETWYMRRDPRP